MSKLHKRRNLAALSPLMRSGGAHQRSASSQRRELAADLMDELEDWYEEQEAEEKDLSLKHKKSPSPLRDGANRTQRVAF